MKASLRWLAAVLLPFVLVAAACSSDDDSDDGGDSGGDTSSEGALSDLDFSGIDVTVGSKDFTEQLVLGEILVQALDYTGANVTNQVNLGGTSVNRESLLSGDIDAYWEYNGTGWTVHLGQEDPSDDPETLTQNVREMDLSENNIHWIGRAPFNNTYGFATGPDLTEENGGPFDFESMAQYLQDNPGDRVHGDGVPEPSRRTGPVRGGNRLRTPREPEPDPRHQRHLHGDGHGRLRLR
ncbi:MAG: glycine betaine ABC transporter substrate-binding protein [Microthrixaceae bacterium]